MMHVSYWGIIMEINSEKREILELLKSGKINPSEAYAILQCQNKKSLEIAVIGIAGKFPKAKNISEFWRNIREGEDCITEVPMQKWDSVLYFEESGEDKTKTYCKWGGFLEKTNQFDSMFFNISGKEAELADPQQRLFLEVCWSALENAGYADSVEKKIGVFAGTNGSGDYLEKIQKNKRILEPQAFWGNDSSIIPARISYFLNLHGPSVAVNTACSSSLVALDYACMNLSAGTCDMALVGGVYTSDQPKFFVMASNASMLSHDGVARAFDEGANGFVPGEAVGCIVLKPLKQAVIDHDSIYGVIEGVGINQDGKTNGITAPSSKRQSALEKEVYEKYGINPEYIDYMETHGTSTSLGDPIEFTALKESFEAFTNKKRFCSLGTVKNNIGHTANAAGMSSLIKVLLSMKYKTIPPLIHFEKENKMIHFEDSPFYVTPSASDWNKNASGSRRAAISSFGFSGTNAHVVVRDAAEIDKAPETEGEVYPFIFSAKTKESLIRYLREFLEWLTEDGEQERLLDIGYTLGVRRSLFKEKLLLRAASMEELRYEIKKSLASEEGFKSDIKEDIKDFYKKYSAYHISLPSYSFDNESFDIEEVIQERRKDQPEIQRLNYTGKEEIILGHKVSGRCIMPFAEYIKQAFKEAKERGFFSLRNISVGKALSIIKEKELEFSIESFQGQKKFSFKDKSEKSQVLCSGVFGVEEMELGKITVPGLSCSQGYEIEKEEIYRIYRERSMNYGKSYQVMEGIIYIGKEAYTKINVEELKKNLDSQQLETIKLDGVLQSIFAVNDKKKEQAVYLPFAMEQIYMGNLPEQFWVHIRQDVVSKKYHLEIADAEGRVLGLIKGFTVIKSKINTERFSDLSLLIQKLISEETKTGLDKIKEEQDFEVYGMDSLMMINIIEALGKYFSDLPKTLLFECRNIQDVMKYLKENNPEETKALLNGSREEDINHSSMIQTQPALQMEKTANSEKEDYAVVGISGRYPKSKNIFRLWENLKNGRDCVSTFQKERKELAEREGELDYGAFLDGVKRFEPLFFHISPKDAVFMDPQERLFLETVYQVFEDAGYTREKIKGSRAGVFTGVMYGHYQLYGTYQGEIDGQKAPSSSFASIANRVSYAFDLRGPSMAVDTMCSSALSALNVAINSIANKECDMAVVGGVNLTIHNAKYTFLRQGNFLSSDGRCRSFGRGGDGYVPGEGVGAVLIKKLSKAQMDGDYIYGTIKGICLNHPGKTSGYSVPDPLTQAEVITRAMKCAQIGSSEINYIEAHGTGTALGDPIEINGLNRALQKDDSTVCHIGSVKSNVGHLESAAGIVALTKVLLQFKYKKLVPSLHSQVLNPDLKIEKTNFRICHDYEDWNPVVKNNQILKRTAGISSFGAGGSNGHMILQEYDNPKPLESEGLNILVFSSNTKESLYAYLREFRDFISLEKDTLSLSQTAYTLASAREKLGKRFAVICGSIDELQTILDEFEDKEIVGTILIGPKEDHTEIEIQRAYQEAQQWITQEDYTLSMPKTARIPLPTHIFCGKEYWIEENPNNVCAQDHMLGFMLDENCSTFDKIAFCKGFRLAESYIAGHVVNNKTCVAGALLLTMMENGVLKASGKEVCQIDHVFWKHMIEVHPNEVQKAILYLEGEENGTIKAVVDSAGKECCTAMLGCKEIENASESISIDDLIENTKEILNRDEIYDRFQKAGIGYEHEFQILERVYCFENMAIGRLTCSKKEHTGRINPFLLDGGFQTVIGLEGLEGTRIPIGMTKMELFDQMGNAGFAVIKRKNKGSYDIAITNETGKITAYITDLKTVEIPKTEQSEIRLLTAALKEQTLPEESGSCPSLGAVLFVGRSNRLYESLREGEGKTFQISRIRKEEKLEKDMVVKAKENYEYYDTVIFDFSNEEYTNGELPIYDILMFLQNIPSTREIKLIFCLPQYHPVYQGLRGFAKTIRQENNKVKIKLISTDVPKEYEYSKLLEKEWETGEEDIFYQNHKRYIHELVPLRNLEQNQPITTGAGCYVIAGGLGKLGGIAAEILGKYRNPVILLGRSECTGEKEEALQVLIEKGVQAVYIQVDILNKNKLKETLEKIRLRYGNILGIINTAGVVKDRLYLLKTRAQVESVVETKIRGTWNLDELTIQDPLQFFVMYASLSGVIGNISQCDYAYANSVLDSFSLWRNRLTIEGKRMGKTISIDWGLWQDGGMSVDNTQILEHAKRQGMYPISKKHGMEALEKILNSEIGNVVAVEGTEKLYESLNSEKERDKEKRTMEHRTEKWQIQEFLAESICNELRLEREELDFNQNFERYGVDSVSILKLTEKIEEKMGVIPKTLFYEFTTVNSLTDYLYKNASFPLEIKKETEGKLEQEQIDKKQEEISEQKMEKKEPRDIAVIGLAGCYPGAENIDEFWENLKNGVDSIEDIPKERWNNQKYYKEGEKDSAIICNRGGFIKNEAKFDPILFNISPREAKIMDPQERLFLQCVCHTMEDAGYSAAQISGKEIGAYVGVMYQLYQLYGNELFLENPMSEVPASTLSSVANRVSYFFNLKGPSIAVDTMCSSSLTALKLACDSIINGECEMALAGGVNLTTHPYKYKMLSQGKFLSEEGLCRSFGEGGEGYVPGEGVGCVLLKPLEKAVEDKDHIYGVVKAVAVNHNGNTTGYSVPSPASQSEVIQKALNKAEVSVESIGYIECHGTGTSLGDPIEIRGLEKAFEPYLDKAGEKQIKIGSVKSNIGHLESAAGIAALTKVLLQLKHKQIVPSLHAEKLNKKIDFSSGNFIVNRELTQWDSPCVIVNGAKAEWKRTAGISSFGAGGTNVHAIIQEYKEEYEEDAQEIEELMIFSGKTKEALFQNCLSMKKYFEQSRCNPGNKDMILLSKIIDIISQTVELPQEEIDADVTLMDITDDLMKLEQIKTELEKQFYIENIQLRFISSKSIQEIAEYIQDSKKGENGTLSLRSAAYVLKCGRTHFKYRTGFKAKTVEEVINKLECVLQNEDLICQEEGEIPEILGRWLSGEDIEWKNYYNEKVHKIHLPGYSFSKKEYSVPKGIEKKKILNLKEEYSPKKIVVQEVETIEKSGDKGMEERLYDKAYEKVRKTITNAVCHILQIEDEELDGDATFHELGIDSILAVDIIENINTDLKIHIKTTEFFNHPSIDRMSDYIMEECLESTDIDLPERFVEQEEYLHGKEEDVMQDKIAIIGMSGKFPGAESLDEFWNNLKNGKDSITETSRWDISGFYSAKAVQEHKSYCKEMGELKSIAEFDPLFFSISPREADMMDPQQRLVLMEAYKALEDAGYCREELEGKKCSVYIGCAHSDYADNMKTSGVQPKNYAFAGNDEGILAARISYFLNLKGPSMSVNTACSSALVAIQLACDSILCHQASMALAGGVSVLTTPEMHIMSSKSQMLSSKGYCSAFGEDADGFIPSEGVGVIVLKRFSDAVADKDHIYGVIEGIALNQDGRTNGITAPNGSSQVELEEEVYHTFQIDPREISYVEAHGTGTKLGDPIEVLSLAKVFSRYHVEKNRCAIGSVKNNIGHTLTAAGMAGIMKILLCIKHGQLVPTIHAELENPLLELENSPFFINRKLCRWENEKRMAAVSSFGFSGTNAHAVISGYQEKQDNLSAPYHSYLIVLSANTQYSLEKKVQDLADWLEDNIVDIGTLSYNLTMCREHMLERLAFIVTDRENLKRELINIREIGVQRFSDYSSCSKRINSSREQEILMERIRDGKSGSSEQLEKIKNEYLKGYQMPFFIMWKDMGMRKISLPTYPFLKEYHWFLPQNESGFRLLSCNTDVYSKNGKTVYQIELEDTMHLISDHVVNGENILPGTAYLELIYELAKNLKLHDIRVNRTTWLKPVVVKGRQKMFLEIEFKGNCYHVKVKSGKEYDKAETNCVSSFCACKNKTVDSIEFSEIENSEQEFTYRIDAPKLYEGLKKAGLFYGNAFQTVKSIFVNNYGAVSRLHSNPDMIFGMCLDPYVLDGALQSLSGSLKTEGEAVMPFELEHFTLFERAFTEQMKAYIKPKGEDVFDIYLKNSREEMIAYIDSITLRRIPVLMQSQELDFLDMVYVPVSGTDDGSGKEKFLVFYDNDSISCFEYLDRNYSVVKGINLSRQQIEEPLEEFDTVFYFSLLYGKPEEYASVRFFKVLRKMQQWKINLKQKRLIVVTNNVHSIDGGKITPFAADLQGFVKTMGREYTRISIGNFDVDLQDSTSEIITSLLRAYPVENGEEVILRKQRGYIRRFEKKRMSKKIQTAFQEKGTYIVIGGAGGIGGVLGSYLCENYRANVVLLGRRNEDEQIRKQMKEMERFGGKAAYHSCNIKYKDELEEAKQWTLQEFGTISGVIHSAMVLKDHIIENMDESELKDTLEPKVDGSMSVGEVFRNVNLDFILFFSSLESFAGNVGQANYAAGCYFEDAYAAYMTQNQSSPVKVINWGYWGSVGAVMDKKYKERLAEMGFYSIEPTEGMEAVEAVLSGEDQQKTVIKIKEEVLKNSLAAKENQDEFQAMESEFDYLEELADTIVLRIFREFHVFTQEGENYDLEALYEQLGIIGKYKKLYHEMINILCRKKYLKKIGNDRVLVLAGKEDLKLQNLEECLSETVQSHRVISYHTILLQSCLSEYKNILTGKVQATEIIFPNSSVDMVGNMYKGNKIADYYNQYLSAKLMEFLDSREIKCSILEIGAGTGGTSEGLLHKLDCSQRVERYTFTDLSVSFLQYGKRKFGKDRDYVEFKILDIEKDIAEQEFEPETYDVIVAANVLHATKNMDNTIQHMEELLKPGGRVFINEVTKKSTFTTITFGLLDGWWLYEDQKNRIDGAPLLSVPNWENVLEQNNFQMVETPNEKGGQSVIIARKSVDKKSSTHDIALEKDSQEIITKEEIREYVKKSLSETLGIAVSTINIRRSLSDYGVDSIIGVDLIGKINKKFCINLKTIVFFDYNNVELLAEHIYETVTKINQEPKQAQSREDSDSRNEELLEELLNDGISVEQLLDMWR